MKRSLVLFAALGLLLAPGALAQGKDRDRNRDRGQAESEWTQGPMAQFQDQGFANKFSPGQARDAVNNGEALPYSTIEGRLMEKYRGEVLRAELFKLENGKLQYEFKWKTGDGRFLELKVDAMTGNVVESSGG